jgi:ferredoxin
MAEAKDKNEENIKGAYYVDNQCIACDACIVEAPRFFKMNDIQGYAYVFKQPSSDLETHLCEEALKGCPVEAIGNDGQ